MKELPTFKTRADLALAVPTGGLMIELGVARGDFAVELVRANPGANYIGIDRYTDHHNDKEWAFALGRITALGHIIFRQTFEEGRNNFHGDSANLVYIDGYAHTGQEGGKTIRDWWTVVKPGGILAGHDYHPKWQPTIDAVDLFVKENELELNIIEEEPYPSWWVRKPE